MESKEQSYNRIQQVIYSIPLAHIEDQTCFYTKKHKQINRLKLKTNLLFG